MPMEGENGEGRERRSILDAIQVTKRVERKSTSALNAHSSNRTSRKEIDKRPRSPFK